MCGGVGFYIIICLYYLCKFCKVVVRVGMIDGWSGDGYDLDLFIMWYVWFGLVCCCCCCGGVVLFGGVFDFLGN